MIAYRLLLVPVLAVAVLVSSAESFAAEHSVNCQRGAVVSVSEPASEVGLTILKQGGNSVDAAVATAFALAVTYPPAGNIGGGGYMLIVPQSGDGSAVFDFREVAPAAATRDMFVDPKQRTAHRRVGVPGTVRGLSLAHQRFGKLNWRALVEPAVKLARKGFAVDAGLAADLNETLADSDRGQFAEFHCVFAPPVGDTWRAGDKLVQPELAEVLARIADEGPDGFYTGRSAELIAEEMKLGGGLITAEDLAAYQPIERKPLVGSYRGYEIVGAPFLFRRHGAD
jgi:gamma-glutamyltranspeptidase/glutathione hydrolase